MAVKRRKEKKLKMQKLIDNSVLIKCCYCDIKNECKSKEYKEKSEKLSIKTHCTLTPNKTKKFSRKRKKK